MEHLAESLLHDLFPRIGWALEQSWQPKKTVVFFPFRLNLQSLDSQQNTIYSSELSS